MTLVANNNMNILDNYLYIENNRITFCEVCEKKRKNIKWFNNPLPFYEGNKYSICRKCEIVLVNSTQYLHK
jgi:hypothetical protein